MTDHLWSGATVDVSQVTWRKSSHSSAQGGNCVEAASFGTSVAIRDSKSPDEPKVVVNRREWRLFAHGLKRGLL
ncbi:DUF397 domain-containing protein [Sphaerisporangium aureirubrum]|uniref:DUF397 domain-containing protein n=1 Tax=Sphaerisporangium aureirubrum TaxID=1544736 RepID=A0ABW1NV83_9ACTN